MSYIKMGRCLPVYLAISTIALQIAVRAACNKEATAECATAGSTCLANSPNCSEYHYGFRGTVSNPGIQDVVTAGSPGFTGTTTGSPCTYSCTITSDCKGQSPEVDKQGNDDVTPSGPSC
jgi:hypothetical protein